MSVIKRKLQVFVSSTFSDLLDERQAAVEAILEAGHIPAGMELFAAANESQLETIYRWIDECDIYMLILGGRYGTIEPKSKLSYTELEFQYATVHEKPHFSIVISEGALDRKVRSHGASAMELSNRTQFDRFKSQVLSQTSSFFEDRKDIKLSVLKSLRKIDADENLHGWVSGERFAQREKQIDELKKDLSGAHVEARRSHELTAELHQSNAHVHELLQRLANAQAQIEVLSRSGLSQVRSKTPVGDIALTPLARDMLESAARSKDATVRVQETISGFIIAAGEKSYKVQDQREVARHKAAVDELVLAGFISRLQNGFSQVTHSGFGEADWIR